MYTVEFYEDVHGKSEVRDYIEELVQNSKIDKNARIGKPIVKHIENNLWELRPLSNRIFFFYRKDNRFVLVHYYIKKSQKTPKKELETARRNIRDWIERNG